MSYKYSYLITFQYLGFRLHGWQKQPNLKTVHWAVDKTLKFVLKSSRFKSVGVGRTDAKVSATDYKFQLFVDKEFINETFLDLFNKNSPADIKVLDIKKISNNQFNIIQHPKVKEYRYYFSFGEKNHPYCAPFLAGFIDILDIQLMKHGAKLFEGKHNFINYCTKPSKETKVIRTVDFCEIKVNNDITASFFPEQSYVLIVRGSGFLRNQIRLMMGALIELGKNNYSLDFIKKSLGVYPDMTFLKTIAPASGLHLHSIKLKK